MILATGFPYDKDTHPLNNVDACSYFIPRIRGIRRMGSAAYDLAQVAAGYFDAYWEFNLKVWDMAAGALLVEEAGGNILHLSQKRGVSIVAGNVVTTEKIHAELRKIYQL